MFEVSARKESRFSARIGIVTIIPRAAIDRIHVLGFTRNHTDGQTSADSFAVSDEIGLHSEDGLRASGMEPEAGNNLIEDECRADLIRDSPHFFQEWTRLHVG